QLENKAIGLERRVGVANELRAIGRHREAWIADRIADGASPCTRSSDGDRLSPARTLAYIAAWDRRYELNHACLRHAHLRADRFRVKNQRADERRNLICTSDLPHRN